MPTGVEEGREEVRGITCDDQEIADAVCISNVCSDSSLESLLSAVITANNSVISQKSHVVSLSTPGSERSFIIAIPRLTWL